MRVLMFLFVLILTIFPVSAGAASAPSPGAAGEARINYTIITAGYLEETAGEIEERIRKILPDARCHFLDYETEEARGIISELELKVLPFVYFHPGLEQQDEFFYLVQNMMIEKRRMYYVIPEKQIRNNMIMYLDREMIPKRLDLFVMGFCPYAYPAEEGLMNLLKENKTDLEAKVRYITKFHDYGIQSMRGPEEIREDVRQIIIQKYFPEKFYDYLQARKEMSFEEAAESLGIDTGFVDDKEVEGLNLLEQDAQMAEEMDISSSPTFVLFNKFAFHSMDKMPLGLGISPAPVSGVSRSESFELKKIGNEIKGGVLTVDENVSELNRKDAPVK